jgi:ubiquinone/menaquinone biosynthesis C-methylase UbiE
MEIRQREGLFICRVSPRSQTSFNQSPLWFQPGASRHGHNNDQSIKQTNKQALELVTGVIERAAAEAGGGEQHQHPHHHPVLDLAAGTGKFTRLLGAHPRLQVVAVEPVAAMRRVFNAAVTPTIGVVEGSATSIPFPDGHFAAVCCAQAFHWFHSIEALREIRRVLRPGCALVLVWNMESRRAPWVAALREVYEAYDHGIPQYRRGTWKNVFELPEARALFPGPMQTRLVLQEMLVTKAEAWERVKSKSYIASLPPAAQGEVNEKVEAVLAQHDDAFNILQRGPDGVERRCARQPIETEVTYVLASPAATPPF